MYKNKGSNFQIVSSNASWIESTAIDQLKKMSTLKGIIKTVGMPDLHPGKTPVGAVYKTKNIVYPHIIGNDIGCGIALFNTSLKRHKFNVEKIIKKYEKYKCLSDIEVDLGDVKEYPLIDKLGTIGSGNHFGEFQAIDQVVNEECFKKLGLNAKQVYLLVHSGSRNYGDYILDHIFNGKIPVQGISVQSSDFGVYMNAHDKALKYAQENREIIASRILSKVQSGQPSRVCESVHNSITREYHEKEQCYIHRKGAAPSNVGPIVIAGTRETPSFIVIPNTETQEYLNSVSHGAGRKWHRSGCKDRLKNKYGKKSVKGYRSQKLICRNKDLYYEEAPDAYKNINQVIQDLEQNNLITVVATLKPLLTIKM